MSYMLEKLIVQSLSAIECEGKFVYHRIAIKIFKRITVIRSIYLILSMLLSITLAESLANVWVYFSQGNSSKAIEFLALFLGISALQMILTYLLSVYTDNQRTKNVQLFLEKIYYFFLNLDNNNRLQTGDYLTLFQKDVDQIAEYYSINLPLIIQSIAGLICYSIYFICFMKNWVILCAILLIGLLQFLPPYIMRKYLVKNYVAAGESEAELTQWIVSGISGYFTIKMYNLHKWFMKKYEDKQNRFRTVGMTASATSAIQTSMEYMLNYIQQIGLAVLLGVLLIYEFISFEVAVQSISLSSNLYSYVKTIFSIYTNRSLYQQAVKRISDGIPYSSDHQTDLTTGKIANGPIRISSLTYHTQNKPIFDNLNLDIKNCCITVFQGANGIGKSTLFQLLLGELRPQKGMIYYGNHIVSRCDSYLYFSYCPQTPIMMNISANILIDMFAQRKEDVLAIIKNFHVSDYILDRPLNTLSGGERKKIMLALCLSSPAPVLLLDEPETSLDHDTVIELGKYLERLCKIKTILVISHEKELFQLAKEVISITENGCVQRMER